VKRIAKPEAKTRANDAEGGDDRVDRYRLTCGKFLAHLRGIRLRTPPRAMLAGLRPVARGTTMQAERGIDEIDGPPLDDGCPPCQGIFAKGES
jgi:hypothetical protein